MATILFDRGTYLWRERYMSLLKLEFVKKYFFLLFDREPNLDDDYLLDSWKFAGALWTQHATRDTDSHS